MDFGLSATNRVRLTAKARRFVQSSLTFLYRFVGLVYTFPSKQLQDLVVKFASLLVMRPIL